MKNMNIPVLNELLESLGRGDWYPAGAQPV